MKESVSEGFANVLLTMMAQSPDHRYATAAECADDLMRLIEGEPPVLVDHSRIRRNEV